MMTQDDVILLMFFLAVIAMLCILLVGVRGH